jgi:hypothetical protein
MSIGFSTPRRRDAEEVKKRVSWAADDPKGVTAR